MRGLPLVSTAVTAAALLFTLGLARGQDAPATRPTLLRPRLVGSAHARLDDATSRPETLHLTVAHLAAPKEACPRFPDQRCDDLGHWRLACGTKEFEFTRASLAALSTVLQAYVTHRNEPPRSAPPVIIDADRETPYAALQHLLARVTAAGFYRLAFAVQPTALGQPRGLLDCWSSYPVDDEQLLRDPALIVDLVEEERLVIAPAERGRGLDRRLNNRRVFGDDAGDDILRVWLARWRQQEAAWGRQPPLIISASSSCMWNDVVRQIDVSRDARVGTVLLEVTDPPALR